MCGRCLNDTTHTSDSVCNCISHSCRCYSFPTSSCNESSVKQSREVPVIFDSSSTNNTDVLNNYASLESLKDVYVDDIVLTGTDTIEITKLKMYLDKTFKIKDLGRLHYFLGMEILDTARGVLISQRKFVLDLLKEYECSNYTSLSSPLDPNVKLRANEGASLSDPTYYRKLVGKLNFLTNTRMDIAFSVQQLSQFMQDPRLPHLQAAFHLLRYIKQDPSLGVYLSRNFDCTMRAYCDSDWATCPDSRRSISGYLILLGDSPISWKSKKQETISLSSAEAEYRSLRKVVGELVYLKFPIRER
uniref:Reverse transcriptase Ty1/copia-type domain-containing protein n=1 Tax=Solanum lycopersicum TaxID=4081 RepID=A0A3Q7F6Z0_SOLLC